MSFVAMVVRRFNLKTDGQAHNREVRLRVEFPVPPAEGLAVDFADDAGPVVVAHVTVRALRPDAIGILPDTLEVRMRTEPGERLDAALAAGWLPVDDPAPAPAPSTEG